jgi:hypothetical protein
VFDSRTSIDSFALSGTPDSLQGYGEVNLLSAVPTSSDEMKAQDLYVLDAFQVAGKTNYVLQLEVAHSDKPLKVTIAWYDPPSGISTSANLLGRNLNLYVRHVASQTKWYGNNAQYNNMDSRNPQERILISAPLTGKYEVYVSSPTSAYTTNAAVVITCHGSVTVSCLSLCPSPSPPPSISASLALLCRSVTSEFTVYTGQLSQVLSPEVEQTDSVSSEPSSDEIVPAFESPSSFLPEMPFS